MQLVWRQTAPCLFLAALLGAVGPAQAQEPAAPDASPEESSADSIDFDGGSLIPLPVIFYQPETGLGFGLTAINYYRMTPGDTISPPSSMTLVGIYTTKNQLILAVWSDMFLDEDRWRISSAVSYSQFPTKYWGIGNDTPDSAEEDYTPKALTLRLWPQKRIATGWYAGLAANIIDRRITEVSDDGLIDSGLAPGVKDEQALGLGGSLIRDSRDNTVYRSRRSGSRRAASRRSTCIRSSAESRFCAGTSRAATATAVCSPCRGSTDCRCSGGSGRPASSVSDRSRPTSRNSGSIGSGWPVGPG